MRRSYPMSSFDLHQAAGDADVPTGRYELPRRSGDAHFYRLTIPSRKPSSRRAKSRPIRDDADVELRSTTRAIRARSPCSSPP